jgi:hypothetical protein
MNQLQEIHLYTHPHKRPMMVKSIDTSKYYKVLTDSFDQNLTLQSKT